MISGASSVSFGRGSGRLLGGDVDLSFVDASQTRAAAAFQTNQGDADAGNLGGAAAIDQSLHIDQSQVNAGDDIWYGW